MNETMKAGRAPRLLTSAANILRELCEEKNVQITDCLGNDTRENYLALVAAIAECRELLCEVETLALNDLRTNAAHHRSCLAAIQELRLPNI